MESLIQIVLPSAILPFLLSVLWWWFIQRNSIWLWSFPLVWLPSFIWLIGWPAWFPSEANQWLGLLVLVSVMINILVKSSWLLSVVLQTILLALAEVIVAWPVLTYQFDAVLIAEMLAVIGAGLVIYIISYGYLSRRKHFTSPALSMTISSAGMGLTVALGGSLLIGELAGALAALLSVFAILDLTRKQASISPSILTPLMQLYLIILLIARIYAEIPIVPSFLLLVAPLMGLISTRRYASVFSAASVIAAISFLMLAEDSSSYY